MNDDERVTSLHFRLGRSDLAYDMEQVFRAWIDDLKKDKGFDAASMGEIRGLERAIDFVAEAVTDGDPPTADRAEALARALVSGGPGDALLQGAINGEVERVLRVAPDEAAEPGEVVHLNGAGDAVPDADARAALLVSTWASGLSMHALDAVSHADLSALKGLVLAAVGGDFGPRLAVAVERWPVLDPFSEEEP